MSSYCMMSLVSQQSSHMGIAIMRHPVAGKTKKCAEARDWFVLLMPKTNSISVLTCSVGSRMLLNNRRLNPAQLADRAGSPFMHQSHSRGI